MLVTVNKNKATSIQDSVVKRILNIYPEEDLLKRPVIEKALLTGIIELKDLKEECSKILMPWQMFFLEETNLVSQLVHIENQRQHKVSSKLLSKRKGVGNITSKRIIDRLIRQQNFLTTHEEYPKNIFTGSLKFKTIEKAAGHILNSFEIDRDFYWELKSKEKALEYFIKKTESKNINVCRGGLTNKILPLSSVVENDIYKNTSGFVIKDDQVPFIFLPHEINPDEGSGRQLYTLVYLLIVIGLNQYDYILEKNLKAKSLPKNGVNSRIHAIASELLMPKSEFNHFPNLTLEIRDGICEKFKVTPSALVTTLRIRGLISQAQYEELKPAPFQSIDKKNSSKRRAPLMSTSIKKFCGSHVYRAISFGIKTKSLPNTQAQYLIFGSMYKKGFIRFQREI